MNLLEELKSVLKKDERLVSDDKLLKNRIVELGLKLDKDLIKLLLSNKRIKEHFFTEVDDILVFDKEKFMKFVDNKKFLPDSYTAFTQNIGLMDEKGRYFKQIPKNEVVLVWPYKDCILEGGQEKEDEKRKEIFHNEILAPDEIDRLLDPKVFTNFKRIDAKREHEVTEIKSTDNLIIKGNNLLVLHSLKKRFAGKVKLIYIDPPYNTGGSGDTFIYNNNFKHSSWLTFTKNRLEVAKKLLTQDGAIIVAIDENEQAYLGVLIDELFPEYENHCVTIVHNPRGIIGTNFSYTHEYAYFIIPKGKKTIGNRKIEEEYVDWRGLRDNGGESLRTDAKNCFYPIIVDKCNNQIIDFGEVCKDNFNPEVNIHKGDFVEIYPIDKSGIERKWRYARQSVEKVKDLLRVKIVNGVYDVQMGKDFGMYRTVWIDKRYDANEYGTKLINSIVPNNTFSFPKSLWNVYDCIYAIIGDDKNAIILDYHAGSGTTAHAVLELNKEDGGNRRFILVEQMDYINTVTCPRVQKVMENLESQKNLKNFDKNRNDFIFCELRQLNEEFIQKIKKASDTTELLKIWEDMKTHAFLSYKIDPKDVDENAEEFNDLSLEDQKKFLIECLDKNNLYVNYSEIEDKQYNVSVGDIEVNNKFYGKL
ncbi:MAG: hypothetical protein A7315_11245 [Candidatus Altiarchaeales archaeon WOR_SM1_79]|nr:MAG: hypothetical protein A7315_11245 [Candidatus Altiarchaeales archaeon WOR_SM1_79]